MRKNRIMNNEIRGMNKKTHPHAAHISYLISHISRSIRGFSLIEMMVAVTIFAIVMMIGVGALLSLIDTNRRAQAINTTINNLNAALEGMSRSIRTGIAYHCSSSNDILSWPGVADCASGGTLLAFKRGTESPEESFVAYRVSNGRLQRKEIPGQSSWLNLTADEITIQRFNVWVTGTQSGNGIQPMALILIEGSAPLPGGQVTTFHVQSSITQRILDI